MEHKIVSPISLIELLKHLYPDSSRRTLQNWIQASLFEVDGTPLKKEKDLLYPGQILKRNAVFKSSLIEGLKILYEDRYLIAVDKQKGLLSVPLDDSFMEKSALFLLRTRDPKSAVSSVHRIDRDASGVLVFAKGKEAQTKLKALFETHDLKREYFAIVEGRMKETKGTWRAPLLELPNYHVIVSNEGKEAVTHFEVIKQSNKYTYLKVQLETGKKHQIRVHCQLAGHPILGDARYGSKENPIRRLCLHATVLEFIHPFTQKKVSFFSPLPNRFKKLGGEDAFSG